MSIECPPPAVLEASDFQKISRIVYQNSGIRLTPGKENLVTSRLMKRLRILGMSNFRSYLRFVHDDRSLQELRIMIDSLTTNKTSFFREMQHFDYFRTHILPGMRQRGTSLRVWSAGCSSGEEPYSIAMLMRDAWSNIDQADVRILATDISDRMLTRGRSGEYDRDSIKDVPPSYRVFFTPMGAGSSKSYRVNDNIRNIVRFARLNLMGEWPMRGPFDVIFCRNVMIYFDASTQRQIVQRFCDILVPGGYLLVGHSESLVANVTSFKYIQPATYMKQKN